MRVLTVPQWSFGRDSTLLRECGQEIERRDLRLHYLASDLDANRSVTAFSGPPQAVAEAVLALCERIFPGIDLERHAGVHPRIGALDMCPFIALPAWDGEPSPEVLHAHVRRVAAELAERYDLPVFLCEEPGSEARESQLSAMRKGGFGGLIGKTLDPDHGPSEAHPHLGVAVVGVRDFQVTFALNFVPAEDEPLRQIAEALRDSRREGDPTLIGVRVLPMVLATRDVAQLLLEATLPDLTPIDPIVEFARKQGLRRGLVLRNAELIGPIRERDLASASHLMVKPMQVVDGEPDDVKV